MHAALLPIIRAHAKEDTARLALFLLAKCAPTMESDMGEVAKCLECIAKVMVRNDTRCTQEDFRRVLGALAAEAGEVEPTE